MLLRIFLSCDFVILMLIFRLAEVHVVLGLEVGQR